MNFEKIYPFLSMGGYGLYVWSAYAATFILLSIPLIHNIYLKRKIRKNASAL
jgi:heme exporter protein CcmD